MRIAKGGVASVATPGGVVTIASPTDESSGTTAADGLTKVYPGRSASTGIAVQPLAEGVRSSIFVDSASSPERYAFTFGGVVAGLEVQPDGSVLALDASGRPIGTVEAPWALDRAGRAVPTHYEVDGLTLVQVIEHRGGAWSYGIVADPSFFFWAKCAAALTLFVAENFTPVEVARFGKILKSAANLVRYLRTYKSMKAATRGLAAFLGSASGVSDLVQHCWPG